MGKRQVEELARRAAADVYAFYAGRRPGRAPDKHVLVLTGDGKGIAMRLDALRPATAKAAAGAGRNWRHACHQGKSTGASGWPSWPASTIAPLRPARRMTSSPRPAGSGKGPRPRSPGGREVADRLGHR